MTQEDSALLHPGQLPSYHQWKGTPVPGHAALTLCSVMRILSQWEQESCLPSNPGGDKWSATPQIPLEPKFAETCVPAFVIGEAQLFAQYAYQTDSQLRCAQWEDGCFARSAERAELARSSSFQLHGLGLNERALLGC